MGERVVVMNSGFEARVRTNVKPTEGIAERPYIARGWWCPHPWGNGSDCDATLPGGTGWVVCPNGHRVLRLKEVGDDGT